MFEQVSLEVGGRTLSFETGKMARQAHGAVVARYGDTVVLATACMDSKAAEKDFLPLTVDYREYTYSAGKIPGGFFKREGRPSEKEILTSRLIDRPLRPLFPEGWSNETQIVSMVLSADSENDPDVIGVTAASAALYISKIPFTTPIAAVRIGMLEGKLVVNPTVAEQKTSTHESSWSPAPIRPSSWWNRALWKFPRMPSPTRWNSRTRKFARSSPPFANCRPR